MSAIRAFIALKLSAEARRVLGAVIQALQGQAAPSLVRWVQPDRLHLTLRFLGETPEAKLEALAAAMDRVAGTQQPFRLELERLGCFPNERQPRVIWVGVRGDVAQAIALRTALNEALQGVGWEPENRTFQPHLTIGRVKERRGSLTLSWGQGVAPAQTEVREMVLFESRLSRTGPTYIVRHVSPLGA